MRRRTRESMRMGENDLRTLRFLLKEQSEGRNVTPADIGALLGMKSSSITVMLDRLTISGHVTREPHPSDRRSIVVRATPGSDEEVRHTLHEMHGRMMAAAAHLGDHDAQIVAAFLGRMRDAVESLDADQPGPGGDDSWPGEAGDGGPRIGGRLAG